MVKFLWKQKCILKQDSACNWQNLTRRPRTSATNTLRVPCTSDVDLEGQWPNVDDNHISNAMTYLCDEVGERMCCLCFVCLYMCVCRVWWSQMWSGKVMDEFKTDVIWRLYNRCLRLRPWDIKLKPFYSLLNECATCWDVTGLCSWYLNQKNMAALLEISSVPVTLDKTPLELLAVE